MQATIARTIAASPIGAIGAASLALFMAQAPAHAASDVSNFNVRNCTSQRIFVCSFDKNDDRMKIPYKAAGIQPNKRKEFGCASLGRCKVIVGVSKRTAKQTLSPAMAAGVAGGSVAAGAIGGGAGFTYLYAAGNDLVNQGLFQAGLVPAVAVGGVVLGVLAGGAIGGIEIADGWSDGEVCNQVRRAAENAGLKPRDFMQNGKKYKIVEQYAADGKGGVYVNPDGSAVVAYATKGGDTCPAPLKTKLIE